MKKEKKISPNKQVEYNRGYICQNCGKYDWAFIEQFERKNYRFLHFFCTHCMMEDFKICDVNSKDIIKMLKEKLHDIKRKNEKTKGFFFL